MASGLVFSTTDCSIQEEITSKNSIGYDSESESDQPVTLESILKFKSNSTASNYLQNHTFGEPTLGSYFESFPENAEEPFEVYTFGKKEKGK